MLRRLFVLPIRFYQLFISPVLPPACRFYPTCSAYALEAIMTHGVLRGGWLALRRLARCHPWGGSDMIPCPLRGVTRSLCFMEYLPACKTAKILSWQLSCVCSWSSAGAIWPTIWVGWSNPIRPR